MTVDADRHRRPQYVLGHSWLGEFVAAATSRGLCALLLADESADAEADLLRRFPSAVPQPDPAAAAEMRACCVNLLDPISAVPQPSLDPRGTDFQRRVWQALASIGAGQMVSYRELAGLIGQPSAVRAVAGACAANPLAVVIPCHRVCRTDGGLGGYRWGLWRKCCLLGREAALVGADQVRSKRCTPSGVASSSASAGRQANNPQVTTPTI